MSKNDTWYGFLQAGDQSSPVVRDARLDTKNPKTIYLFNFVRGRFLEYSREIVEPKLEDLRSDHVPLSELKNAFKAARKEFVSSRPAEKRVIAATARNTKTSGPTRESELPENSDEDFTDIFDTDEYADS